MRVLDLTRLLPGGYCTLLLADLGAEVLKVEDTGGGDYIRWMPPYYGEDGARAAGTASAYFLGLNRNKGSVRLNLKHPRGREAFLRLVEDYDVVVESFRPGVMDRLESATRRCASATRGSSSARSRVTGPTARCATGPVTTPTTWHWPACSGLPAAAAARRSSRPVRSPTSAAVA